MVHRISSSKDLNRGRKKGRRDIKPEEPLPCLANFSVLVRLNVRWREQGRWKKLSETLSNSTLTTHNMIQWNETKFQFQCSSLPEQKVFESAIPEGNPCAEISWLGTLILYQQLTVTAPKCKFNLYKLPKVYWGKLGVLYNTDITKFWRCITDS